MARHLKTILVLVAVLAAAVCGIAAVFARFSDAISEGAFHMIACAAASVAALFFISMLFDPSSHFAVNAAKRELQGEQPFKFRFISLFDEKWGLFGAKGGNGFLLALRCALFVEFLVALVTTPLTQSLYGAAPLILAALGFAISILLSLDRLKNHYPRPTGQ